MDSDVVRVNRAARVHRLRDAKAVAEAAARFVASSIESAIAANGKCRLALSGGSTPRATYERLTEPDLSSQIAWARLEVFFGDERMVPPTDPSSNYRMAREAMLDRVPIPPENVHRIEGELEASAAADKYALELGAEPLDVVLLGMGDDGHVASLFPGSAELLRTDRSVFPSHAPVVPHDRVSIALPVINAARAVVLLVTGESKAARVAEVFQERASGAPRLPAARVAPQRGELHWFLDAAARAVLEAATKEA
ncbi:MAG TPA: 6-phosphogluconolactonase [Polyangiaceae bacterium]|jgi:6-phosphogluconolactonase|nr:6-phosphogluconolactonase [Polyangiaceae bacterium]